MDENCVKVIKISKQALFEFIYENFIAGQEQFLDVDPLEVSNSFDIHFERGKFIFCAYKSENEKGEFLKLPAGIDLQKVKMQASGNEITFFLPEVEVLMDNLTPSEIYRDDFWYPGFSDQDYEKLLETERLRCREKYLSGEYQEQLWQASLDAFEQTIASWLTSIHSQLVFHYERITLEE